MRILRSGCLIALLAVIALLSMYACSGGGGSPVSSSTMVSGVAATGAPINGTVTLKDRNGLLSGPVPTDSEGNYSLNVEGLTPPFILKAEWTEGSQTQTLYSAAMRAGDTHINPLTNLALALATGLDPAAVFGASGAAPNASQISDASLTSAVGQIKSLMTPLLNGYGVSNFDPLNGAYTATPENRLDAMLDVIDVKAETGQITITNRLTGMEIASGSAANPAGIALNSAKSPDVAVLQDIRDITTRIGALGTAMKRGTSLTAADMEGFFVADPSYGTSSGHTRSQDITNIVANFGPGGSNTNGPLKELRNVRLVGDISAQYSDRGVSKVYILNYDFIYENGRSVHGNNVAFGKETTSGLWKFIGDPMDGTLTVVENIADGISILEDGSGTRILSVNRDADITLTDTGLTVGSAPPLALNGSIASAIITSGASANVINVSGWTGTVTIIALKGGGTVTGNGTNTTLKGQNASNTWTITASNAGSLTGAGGTTTFSAVGNLTGGLANDTFALATGINTFNGAIAGGGGTDTLKAATGANTWVVTGANAGRLNATTTFSAISTLTGGSATDAVTVTRDANIKLTDTRLTVGNEAALNLSGIESATLTGGTTANTINVSGWTKSATITATSGADIITGNGANTTLTGQNTANAWSLTAANAGTLTNASGTTTFTAVSALVGGTANDTLIGLSSRDTYNITSANSVTLTTGAVSATSINSLIGGAGNDTFTLASNMTTFTGAIVGGGGTDVLTVQSGSNTWTVTGANAGTVNTTTAFISGQ